MPSPSLLCHVMTNPPETTQKESEREKQRGAQRYQVPYCTRGVTAQMKRGPVTLITSKDLSQPEQLLMGTSLHSTVTSLALSHQPAPK